MRTINETTEIDELAGLFKNSRVRTGSTKKMIEDFLKTGLSHQFLPKLLTNGQVSGINNRYGDKVVVKNVTKDDKKVTVIMRKETWEQIREKLNKQ